MRELMQPCNKMLVICLWLGDEYPCDELFQVTKGSYGFCCSFNYNATKDLIHKSKHFRVSGRRLFDWILVGAFSSLKIFVFSNRSWRIRWPRNNVFGRKRTLRVVLETILRVLINCAIFTRFCRYADEFYVRPARPLC